jgi:hypothetical protein
VPEKHTEEGVVTPHIEEEGEEKLHIYHLPLKEWTFQTPFNSKPPLLPHPPTQEEEADKLIPAAQNNSMDFTSFVLFCRSGSRGSFSCRLWGSCRCLSSHPPHRLSAAPTF